MRAAYVMVRPLPRNPNSEAMPSPLEIAQFPTCQIGE